MPDQGNQIIEHYQFANREQWTQALQQKPNPTWLKTRDLGSKKSTYLPLGLQQALADKFFRECDVKDEHYSVVANEILCTVRISILPDYPNSEHRIISGTGAKPIQMDQGKLPSSFPSGKKSNALEYCAPAARAAAISNALTTFANIFGRNLSRDMQNDFSFIRTQPKTENNDNKS